MESKQEQMVIPILDLDKFIFSPPGPMGWALSEYEQTLGTPQDIVLNELSVVENLAAVKEEELVELPTIGLLDLKEVDNNQEIATSEELVEEVTDEVTDEIIELEEKEDLVPLEPENPKIKVRLIAPHQPVAPKLMAGVEISKKKEK
ncbi:hypothetical protein U2I54_18750 [Bacillus pseudomycoides]|uniref:Uncharacterized protein n=1 Tax=Bacillus bingmayongensis TaxID=1150157 RepID=A0ABU5K004_9BACI|nr:hypothetical protein [Bacillus pseudomycoides]